MPERRVCNFTHEEIEPGTGMMFVRRDGTVLWFKDSKSRKNIDRKSTRLNSSHKPISYAVFCLKKKTDTPPPHPPHPPPHPHL